MVNVGRIYPIAHNYSTKMLKEGISVGRLLSTTEKKVVEGAGGGSN